MGEETITITLAQYKKLLKDQEWLNALEQAGVDNWSGLEQAHEIHDEMRDEMRDEKDPESGSLG